MNALGPATRAEIAVLLVHHQRTGGGEDGDAVRGSGAIFGAVDALVEVERLGGDAPPEHRRLVAAGRWLATPPVLVVDRDAAATWRVIGEATDRDGTAALSMRERVLRSLPGGEPGATEPDLAELIGIDVRKIGGPLRKLVEQGAVARSGGGKRGDPYRYRRTSADALRDSLPRRAFSARERRRERRSRAGMTEPLMSADEVAALLGVGRNWVYAETRAGRIPHVRLGRYRRTTTDRDRGRSSTTIRTSSPWETLRRVSGIDWERVARAHLNATRLLVLDAIAAAGQPASAAVLARTLGRPTNEVAYHVAELAGKGLIALHSSRQGRGARETFYVLT